MGFIIGCFLLGLIAKTAWDFFRHPSERKKLIEEYRQQPFTHIFVVIWMVFFIMFFLGVFAPIFGEIEISENGWKVWQVGILGFFGCWVLTFFFDIDNVGKGK